MTASEVIRDRTDNRQGKKSEIEAKGSKGECTV